MAKKKGPKKKRTAKQKAASKKNIKKAQKARGTSKKVNKKRGSRSRTVPKKKGSKKRSPGKKTFIDKIPILNNPTVQKIGFGLGMGLIAKEIIQAIPVPAVQQNSRLIVLGVEALTEPLSAVADLVLQSGVVRNISTQFTNGGVGIQNSQNGGGMVGFA